ncbi:MAG: hypothetical protein IJA03_03325 [Bacteroidaceae bacterium]|nr:hypothetical protein [Bacteroidaceae bacterium]
MDQSIINGIGNSMRYWANYISAVKRDRILNEGSIKYGISEYLVASENLSSKRVSTGQPRIEKVIFEESHDIFKKRRSDLLIEVSEGETTKNIFFEFKYIKKTINRNEINRYIDDIFRLASLIKYKDDRECFFMLVGVPEHIKKLLGKLEEEHRVNINDLPHIDFDDIKECLPYNTSESSKTINLEEFGNNTGENHLERFKSEYEYRSNVISNKRLSPSNRITIELKYNTEHGNNESIAVYIWQIKIS